MLPLRSLSNRDPSMNAMDRSHTAIVCVSSEYLASVSHRMEALYAESRQKQSESVYVPL
jgi:hypothetical protein